eukprot:scaffold24349_cov111-Isochrysis_galbana.AAC.4
MSASGGVCRSACVRVRMRVAQPACGASTQRALVLALPAVAGETVARLRPYSAPQPQRRDMPCAIAPQLLCHDTHAPCAQARQREHTEQIHPPRRKGQVEAGPRITPSA